MKTESEPVTIAGMPVIPAAILGVVMLMVAVSVVPSWMREKHATADKENAQQAEVRAAAVASSAHPVTAKYILSTQRKEFRLAAYSPPKPGLAGMGAERGRGYLPDGQVVEFSEPYVISPITAEAK